MQNSRHEEKEKNIEMYSRPLYVPPIKTEEEKTPQLSSNLIKTRLVSLYNILAKLMRNKYSFCDSQTPLITRNIAQQYSHKNSLNDLLVTSGFLSIQSALYKSFLTSPLFDPDLIKTKSELLEYADKSYGYLIVKRSRLWDDGASKKAAEDWALKNDCGEIYVLFNSSSYKEFYLYTFGEWRELDLKKYDPIMIENRLPTSDFSIDHWSGKGSTARGTLCSMDDFRETQKAFEKLNLVITLTQFDELLSRLPINKRLTDYLIAIAEFGKLIANDLGLEVSKNIHKPLPTDDDIVRLRAVQSAIIILQSIAVCYDYRFTEANVLLKAVKSDIFVKEAYRAELYSQPFATKGC